MSLKIKNEIWKSNKRRTSAKLIFQFTSERHMDTYLKQHVKCPENKDNFNNGWHEWNDSTSIDGIDGVRSICDFCGLIIVDIPIRKIGEQKR